MRKHPLLSTVLALSAFGAVGQAQAYILGNSNFNAGNVLTIDGSTALSNIDSGWYATGTGHDPSNQNYLAGTCCSNGNHNSFFVFDISTLSGPVSTASFTLFTYDASETLDYALYDFTGSIDELVAGSGGAAAYNDLANGVYYGGGAIGPSDNQSFKTFTLTGNAVNSLNSAITAGQTHFVIGGTTTPVPEPVSLALLAAGLGIVGFVAKRRQA